MHILGETSALLTIVFGLPHSIERSTVIPRRIKPSIGLSNILGEVRYGVLSLVCSSGERKKTGRYLTQRSSISEIYSSMNLSFGPSIDLYNCIRLEEHVIHVSMILERHLNLKRQLLRHHLTMIWSQTYWIVKLGQCAVTLSCGLPPMSAWAVWHTRYMNVDDE